jgi:hypothetical protein
VGSTSLEGFYIMGLPNGEKALPVFSSEEEADLFLGSCEEGWEIREVPAKDLISLLLKECRGVRQVALDPVAGIDPSPMATGWGVFLDSLLGRGRHWFEIHDGYHDKKHGG